jgi:hypothetical protein
LREVFYSILEFSEEKQTFTKVEEVNVDFFLYFQRILAQV